MLKFELLIGINEVLVYCIKSSDLELGEEVTHHIVKETHRASLEVTTEGPKERECEERLQWARPNLLVIFLEQGQIFSNEVFKEAA